MTEQRRLAIIESDAKVIAALRERGDDLDLAREVKHWALFSSPEGAQMYSETGR